MATPKKIEIAVIGGGIGGLCLAIGLLKHKHLNVNIYEAAHKFAEIGAGVALGPNSQRAMIMIDKKIHEAFLTQVTNNGWESQCKTWFQFRNGMEGHGEELLTTPTNQTGQATVHRALFLDELVKLVPKEIAHFGKRVEEIVDNGEEGITLHFKDGTTVVADAVIGADGVHSPTRRFLLGADHPATAPQFTNTIAYRGLIPMDQAREALGSEFAENSIIWVNQNNIIMTYPISFGKIMNAVAIQAGVEKWEHAEWVIPAD
jgi:salicylate hydroxylase